MEKLGYAIYIRAPVEKVFGYVADWANAARYVPNLANLRPTGPVRYGLGTRLRGEVRVLGVSLDSESETVEFVPPGRIVTRSVGGLVNKGTWLFEPVRAGTRVTAMVEYKLSGLLRGRLAGSLVRLRLEEDVRGSLENLKRLLESGE